VHVHKALVLAGVAGLLAVTACSKSDTGKSAAADPPVTSSAAGASTTAAAPAAKSDPTKFGPDGYDGFTLGESMAQVKAAGVKLNDPNEPCPYGVVTGPGGTAQVDVSAKIGVFRISTSDPIPTPGGVKTGDSAAAVKKAYPSLGTDGDLVGVPGNPKANYQFDVSGGTLGSMEIKFIDSISPDC
jgi:hypothetical protein